MMTLVMRWCCCSPFSPLTSVVGGIFKAGFWVGIILAAVIVVGLVMLLRK